MEINSILLGVLLALASALCGFGIWAILEGVKTARSARVLTDDLDVRMVPLLEKADITIDALNAELLRVDTIVSRIEEITDRMDSTSRTVQGVANAPGEIVTDIADRVRRAWKRRQAESAVANDARRAEAAAEAEERESSAEAESAADVETVTAPASEAAPEPPQAPEPPTWPTAGQPETPATESTPASAGTTPV